MELEDAIESYERAQAGIGVEVDYVVTDDAVVVVAVFHGKRRPGYWRERLKHI